MCKLKFEKHRSTESAQVSPGWTSTKSCHTKTVSKRVKIHHFVPYSSPHHLLTRRKVFMSTYQQALFATDLVQLAVVSRLRLFQLASVYSRLCGSQPRVYYYYAPTSENSYSPWSSYMWWWVNWWMKIKNDVFPRAPQIPTLKILREAGLPQWWCEECGKISFMEIHRLSQWSWNRWSAVLPVYKLSQWMPKMRADPTSAIHLWSYSKWNPDNCMRQRKSGR